MSYVDFQTMLEFKDKTCEAVSTREKKKAIHVCTKMSLKGLDEPLLVKAPSLDPNKVYSFALGSCHSGPLRRRRVNGFLPDRNDYMRQRKRYIQTVPPIPQGTTEITMRHLLNAIFGEEAIALLEREGITYQAKTRNFPGYTQGSSYNHLWSLEIDSEADPADFDDAFSKAQRTLRPYLMQYDKLESEGFYSIKGTIYIVENAFARQPEEEDPENQCWYCEGVYAKIELILSINDVGSTELYISNRRTRVY